jgi:hypothetical protein
MQLLHQEIQNLLSKQTSASTMHFWQNNIQDSSKKSEKIYGKRKHQVHEKAIQIIYGKRAQKITFIKHSLIKKNFFFDKPKIKNSFFTEFHPSVF